MLGRREFVHPGQDFLIPGAENRPTLFSGMANGMTPPLPEGRDFKPQRIDRKPDRVIAFKAARTFEPESPIDGNHHQTFRPRPVARF